MIERHKSIDEMWRNECIWYHILLASDSCVTGKTWRGTAHNILSFTSQRWWDMTKKLKTGFYALIRERKTKKKEKERKNIWIETAEKMMMIIMKNAHPSISNYVKLFTGLTIVTRISHFYCQKLTLLLYIMLSLFKVKSFSSLIIYDTEKIRLCINL